MKKLFKVIATIVLVAPLLIATKCHNPMGPPNVDQGCEMACVVWLNYVDENGEKIPFGTEGYPDTVSSARCEKWIDIESGESLAEHSADHYNLRNVKIGREVAHSYILAAPARNGSQYKIVKATIVSFYSYNYIQSIEDDIEVELHYNTPDNAYIKTIKINGEVKWDRSSFTDGKVPEHIIVDLYLDITRLNK